MTAITFYLPGEDDLEALRHLDPDRDWAAFRRGEHAWILQTFLRLARAGHPVRLADVPPADGLVVFHAKHRRELLSARAHLRDAVLVGVRGDLREPLIADFEVLQNGGFADRRRRFFVPHWPQGALQPRDPERGTAISCVAYKGFDRNLHPAFRAPAWAQFLAERGIRWQVDSVEFTAERPLGTTTWPDYRQVDLVLAVRPPDRRGHTGKPATKLINAWHAGTPALLGPEVAYRELRRSELDYLEVADLDAAQAAVLRLLAEPERYRAMVEQGRQRAAGFTPEAILGQWVELLCHTLPALAATPRARRARRLPLPLRGPLRRLLRLLSPGSRR